MVEKRLVFILFLSLFLVGFIDAQLDRVLDPHEEETLADQNYIPCFEAIGRGFASSGTCGILSESDPNEEDYFGYTGGAGSVVANPAGEASHFGKVDLDGDGLYSCDPVTIRLSASGEVLSIGEYDKGAALDYPNVLDRLEVFYNLPSTNNLIEIVDPCDCDDNPFDEEEPTSCPRDGGEVDCSLEENKDCSYCKSESQWIHQDIDGDGRGVSFRSCSGPDRENYQDFGRVDLDCDDNPLDDPDICWTVRGEVYPEGNRTLELYNSIKWEIDCEDAFYQCSKCRYNDFGSEVKKVPIGVFGFNQQQADQRNYDQQGISPAHDPFQRSEEITFYADLDGDSCTEQYILEKNRNKCYNPDIIRSERGPCNDCDDLNPELQVELRSEFREPKSRGSGFNTFTSTMCCPAGSEGETDESGKLIGCGLCEDKDGDGYKVAKPGYTGDFCGPVDCDDNNPGLQALYGDEFFLVASELERLKENLKEGEIIVHDSNRDLPGRPAYVVLSENTIERLERKDWTFSTSTIFKKIWNRPGIATKVLSLYSPAAIPLARIGVRQEFQLISVIGPASQTYNEMIDFSNKAKNIVDERERVEQIYNKLQETIMDDKASAGDLSIADSLLQRRGVCRHKGCFLTTMLDEAEIKSSQVFSGDHAWTRIEYSDGTVRDLDPSTYQTFVELEPRGVNENQVYTITGEVTAQEQAEERFFEEKYCSRNKFCSNFEEIYVIKDNGEIFEFISVVSDEPYKMSLVTIEGISFEGEEGDLEINLIGERVSAERVDLEGSKIIYTGRELGERELVVFIQSLEELSAQSFGQIMQEVSYEPESESTDPDFSRIVIEEELGLLERIFSFFTGRQIQEEATVLRESPSVCCEAGLDEESLIFNVESKKYSCETCPKGKDPIRDARGRVISCQDECPNPGEVKNNRGVCVEECVEISGGVQVGVQEFFHECGIDPSRRAYLVRDRCAIKEGVSVYDGQESEFCLFEDSERGVTRENILELIGETDQTRIRNEWLSEYTCSVDGRECLRLSKCEGENVGAICGEGKVCNDKAECVKECREVYGNYNGLTTLVGVWEGTEFFGASCSESSSGVSHVINNYCGTLNGVSVPFRGDKLCSSFFYPSFRSRTIVQQNDLEDLNDFRRRFDFSCEGAFIEYPDNREQNVLRVSEKESGLNIPLEVGICGGELIAEEEEINGSAFIDIKAKCEPTENERRTECKIILSPSNELVKIEKVVIERGEGNFERVGIDATLRGKFPHTLNFENNCVFLGGSALCLISLTPYEEIDYVFKASVYASFEEKNFKNSADFILSVKQIERCGEENNGYVCPISVGTKCRFPPEACSNDAECDAIKPGWVCGRGGNSCERACQPTANLCVSGTETSPCVDKFGRKAYPECGDETLPSSSRIYTICDGGGLCGQSVFSEESELCGCSLGSGCLDSNGREGLCCEQNPGSDLLIEITDSDPISSCKFAPEICLKDGDCGEGYTCLNSGTCDSECVKKCEVDQEGTCHDRYGESKAECNTVGSYIEYSCDEETELCKVSSNEVDSPECFSECKETLIPESEWANPQVKETEYCEDFGGLYESLCSRGSWTQYICKTNTEGAEKCVIRKLLDHPECVEEESEKILGEESQVEIESHSFYQALAQGESVYAKEAYQLLPSGLEYNIPARLTLKYDGALFSKNDGISISRYADDTYNFEVLDSLTLTVGSLGGVFEIGEAKLEINEAALSESEKISVRKVRFIDEEGNCLGCVLGEKCLEEGFRAESLSGDKLYCLDSELENQIDIGSCFADYQCLSNKCFEGECVSLEEILGIEEAGLLKRLVCRLTNIGENYEECLLE